MHKLHVVLIAVLCPLLMLSVQLLCACLMTCIGICVLGYLYYTCVLFLSGYVLMHNVCDSVSLLILSLLQVTLLGGGGVFKCFIT